MCILHNMRFHLRAASERVIQSRTLCAVLFAFLRIMISQAHDFSSLRARARARKRERKTVAAHLIALNGNFTS